MIQKIHACNRMNFSSTVNEVIRAVLNFFFFFNKNISHAPKAQKAKKAPKASKAQKAKKRKSANKNKKCA